MSAACQAYRESLPEDRAGRFVPAGHGLECSACAAWVAGLERQAEGLRALARKTAPQELEGRVVASLEAGFRQSRAVDALGRLSRLTTPTVVDEALAGASDGLGLGRLKAPDVLARLIEEELQDPRKARVRRYVGSLRRAEAPEGLLPLLNADLGAQASPLELVPAGDPARRPVPRAAPVHRARRWLLAAAAGLLGLIGLRALQVGPNGLLGGPGETQAHEWPFAVERLDSAAALDPTARSLIDGVGGWILTGEGQ